MAHDRSESQCRVHTAHQSDDLVHDAHPTGQRSTQANLSLYHHHPSAATEKNRSSCVGRWTPSAESVAHGVLIPQQEGSYS